MEMLEAKHIITKMRNSLEGLKSRHELGGGKNISELEDYEI